jgi:alanine racemase
MTFTVYVDERRWRTSQRKVLADFPGLVPVAKGNGYGVGNVRLAAEAAALGVDTIAVGTEREVSEVSAHFGGDVLVLTPVGPSTSYEDNPNVIRTVARVDLLDAVPAGARIVIECRTHLNRHGIQQTEIDGLTRIPSSVRVEGFAFHWPFDPRRVTSRRQTAAWLDLLASAGIAPERAWVSHLFAEEVADLARSFQNTTIRPRIGTNLWLGDRDSLVARGTVLEIEPVTRGQRVGYHQHAVPSRGHLVVVSGGTAHGVALEAPKSVRGLVSRAKVVAAGALEAAGRNLSPFTWAGKQRWFLEPPHMQVSLIFVPEDVPPPAIGTELECRVRLTTTHPDRVVSV